MLAGLCAVEMRVTIYLPAEENPEVCQGMGTGARRESQDSSQSTAGSRAWKIKQNVSSL